MTPEEEVALEKELLRQEAGIRETLSGLRTGQINVLIATSVVEEGVDVQACSFVAAFDEISSIRSYVQMKGRARQEDAMFFAFSASSDRDAGDTLRDLQQKERVVQDFISRRTLSPADMAIDGQPATEIFPLSGLSTEMAVVDSGMYRGPCGSVTIESAKSLLNRFALAQPMDPIVRWSKRALVSYLPEYDSSGDVLYLPAHIALKELREIRIPSTYRDRSRKERANVLALIACVRLHQCGLLNDRLLPHCQETIRGKLLSFVTEEYRPDFSDDAMQTVEDGDVRDFDVSSLFYVYPIFQTFSELGNFASLLDNCDFNLALVSSARIPEIAEVAYRHPEFTEVKCTVGTATEIDLSNDHLDILLQFFLAVFNVRWNRKSKRSPFVAASAEKLRINRIPSYRA